MQPILSRDSRVWIPFSQKIASTTALLAALCTFSFSSAATPPVITGQPLSATVFYGETATFSVSAAGTAPLRYQWYRDGEEIPTATGPSYSLAHVGQPDHQAEFTVKVLNSDGTVASAPAVLTVDFGLPGTPEKLRLLNLNSVWKYRIANLDTVNWTAPAFDDSQWDSGPGLLAYEDSGAILPLIGTFLTDPRNPLPSSGLSRGHAFFFRTTVNVPDAHSIVPASATFRCDDGAVVYINGQEATRIRMDEGPALTQTYSSGNFAPGEATEDEFLTEFSGVQLKPGENVIAVSVHQANRDSSDVVWGMALDVNVHPRIRDTQAPTATELLPFPGTVATFNQLEVRFSEAVTGIKAADLLINGAPATKMIAQPSGTYVFEFTQPAPGEVRVSWDPGHTVTDASANSNRMQGLPYTYVLDPSAVVAEVRISEFLAGNTRTMDDQGEFSDWIELQNTSDHSVNLSGWYLTDSRDNLARWRIPTGVSLPARSFLVIWASGANLANASSPLHTNFRLSKTRPGYLALVMTDGQTVASEFPTIPEQFDDVSYGLDRLNAAQAGYFTQPSPGAANGSAGLGFAPTVRFSRESGTFQGSFQLELTCDDPSAIIRYHLVDDQLSAQQTNVPTATSSRYMGPLTIDRSVQVRARAFPAEMGYLPSASSTESYVRITPAAAAFSSPLPIVLFHNFTGGTPPANYDQPAVMMVFGTGNGRATMANAPDLVQRIGMNIRGRSTQGMPKKSYAVETWGETNEDEDVALLGLPAESDWVFYAPNLFDQVMLHNPLAHEMSRAMGRYSSRTRFVEVFASTTADPVTYVSPADQYQGVYVVEEKIKRNSSRANLARLTPADTNAATISGGYIMKIDQQDSDERSIWAGGVGMVFVEPQMQDYDAYPARQVQENYISDYFNRFYDALQGPNWRDSNTGYRAYIDVDSWIDHSILSVISLNADSLRLSGYFFKDRDQKIEMGPAWDFDRSFGTSSGSDWRPWNPRTWTASNPLGGPDSTDYGTDYFNPSIVFHNPWYSLLFQDPDFWQRWIDRFQELRRGEFSTSAMRSRIDELAADLHEPQAREAVRWPDSRSRSGLVVPPPGYPDTSYSHNFPGTYQGEIDFLKRWVTDRLDFIDTNFLAQPVLTVLGTANDGQELSIAAPAGRANTTVYYTLDGSDPRLPGGGVSPTAKSTTTTVSLTLTNNTRLFARSYNPSHANLSGFANPPLTSPWSGPTTISLTAETAPLVVTEMMYHPAPPATGTIDKDEFEYIELKNRGTETLNLVGIRFTDGIDYTFTQSSAITTLAPGAYVLLVKNLGAFQQRYPGVANIAGVYLGSLNNAGEAIAIQGPLQEPLLSFEYKDAWYPNTDGAGFSLVIRNESAPLSSWSDAASWRPSSEVGGSPGRTDPPPADVPTVYVNEVLTHTDPPEVDTIELFNPNDFEVNIGGWFLSDDRTDPIKFRIPNDTRIPAGGYVIFIEPEFDTGSDPFALSSMGDSVYLSSGDGSNLTGYSHGFNFGAQVNSVSFGRHVTSDGREVFVAQAMKTLREANAGPRVGPIIINEIMYAPPAPGTDPNTVEEYIELRNITAAPAPLYDPRFPTNTWKFANGVEYAFPQNATLPAGGYLLVVGFDPVQSTGTLTQFRTRYGLDASIPIYGPWTGVLANQGETIELTFPDTPEMAPSPNPGFVPSVLAEEVDYSPTAPWPTGVVGTGNSLQRVGVTFGDDPANWTAAVPTPGRSNSGVPDSDTDQDGLPNDWELANGLDPNNASGDNGAAGDPDADGMTNAEEFTAGTNPRDAADALRLQAMLAGNNTFVLQFTGKPDRVYTVERADNLGPGASWSVLQDNLNGSGAITVSDPAGNNARFYRVRVRNP